MQKIKDIVLCMVLIGCFISVIGLLMAWDDGYLDGSLIADILSVIVPTVIATYVMAIIVGYWENKLVGYTHSGFIFAICFIVSLLCFIFFDLEQLFVPITVVMALLLITLLVFWLENIFK